MSDSRLDRVQQQVADRQPIDWDALVAELHAAHASPDEIQAFSLLRLLDDVALVHTSFQSGPVTSDDDEGTIPADDPVVDDTLESWGRYLLDHKVGRGGFGSVYRAWDPVLEMAVAIKILHRRFSDARLKERLLHEGRALAQVKHPNVVQVLNVEQHDGRFGLVMEFVSGETLDALVATQGKLNDREAVVIGEDVCRALVAVHAKGLIHRDVKARNIIRERAGRIVLMDFGAGMSTKSVQVEGRAAGTPLYMAPENLRGQPATVASDVYSVGVLLFFLVTERHPYEGASVEDIRNAQSRGRPQSLVGLRPDLPLSFVRVVERALAVDPARRYPTPAALLEALDDAPPVAVNWTRRALRLGTAVASLLVLMTIGGMLSAAAFNATLGRRGFVSESLVDWFVLGRRSLVSPLVLSLLGAGLVGLAAALRRVLVTSSVTLRAVDRRIGAACGVMATRLLLTDPAVCSAWLVLLTAVGLMVIWAHWAPVLEAVTSYTSTAAREALAVLSPPFLEYRTHYRMALSLLIAANLTGWYALSRGAATRGVRLPPWLGATEAVILVLLYLSMQIPYRLLNDSDKFESLLWQGERCFVIGARAADTLLFCPSMLPRNRVVPTAEAPTARSRSGTLFDGFDAPLASTP